MTSTRAAGTPDQTRLYAQSVSRLEAENPIAVDACPVCHAEQAVPLYAISGCASQLVVCVDCRLGRLHPIPDSDTIRALYPDYYYGSPGSKFRTSIEKMVRIVGKRQSRFVAKGLTESARVLDVGCGRGVMLSAMADLGFEVHGTDISELATQGVDSRAEIRIAANLSDALYPESFFDVVVIWHVLEHLTNPRETLEEVHRVLRPGGRIVVAVPNFSSLQARLAGSAWFHLDLPRHLFHFPLHSLRRILAEVGFEVGQDYHFSLRQNPFGWIQSMLNCIPRLQRNVLYSLLHRNRTGVRPNFTTRLALGFVLTALIPPALLATVVGTVFRRGATVHIEGICLESK